MGNLRFLTAGESHGQCLTAIVEGIPAGLKIDIDEMNRGNLEANAAGETIREGGKFTNLKINKLGKR